MSGPTASLPTALDRARIATLMRSAAERPDILARLEAEGRLRRAKNPGYLPERLHLVSGEEPSPLTRALLDEREDERW